MLGFLKAVYGVLGSTRFLVYINVWMMSEILLMALLLMALLPVRNVPRPQIFTSSFSCFLKRNLIVETLCIGTEKAF